MNRPVPLDLDTPSLDPRDWKAATETAHRLVDRVMAHLEHVGEGPCWRPVPAEARVMGPLRPPKEGIGLDRAMDLAVESSMPYGSGNLHPRFWGWVLGAGNVPGMLGDWLSTALNANAWGGNQGAVWREAQLMAWFKDLMGFPAEASGLLVDGCSMANLQGMAVARHWITEGRVKQEGLWNGAELRIYASDATHSSIPKGAALLGLGERSVNTVPSTASGTIDLEALRQAIRADRAKGFKPFMVVGNAGTVGIGAIDPLDELRAVCDEEGLWFHVDGAIGAIAMLSGTLRERLKGIEKADSLAFDLHKWAQVPYDAGCLLVRNAPAHLAAFSHGASYLQTLPGGLTPADAPYFADLSPFLSRGDRTLKIWMTWMAFGTEGLSKVLEANVRQAQRMAELAESSPDLQLMAPLSLNIVCFRWWRHGLDATALDAINSRILVDLQESGEAMMSPYRIEGRFCFRAAITNHRTQDLDIDRAIRFIQERGSQLALRGPL